MALHSFSVHAHFYQPPREDPITGIIPSEPGAAPYSNWNERVLAECYRPNAELGNFERISFNIGPTLCTWMHAHDPDTCQLIRMQDQANLRRFGVGNAIAQPYNHTILPLASRSDKITQIAWGVADFKHRFGRKPEGMWLPETAADLETLNVLADHGITFTILAPWQAHCERLDPTEPYRVALPAGKSITVFFYHRELSTGISFDPALTNNADIFVRQVLSSQFDEEKTRRNEPQLLLLASDGELYGHHQPFRDRFLAHLVNGASSQTGLTSTFPALWLKMYPPRRTISIRDKTSWSCHHGVARWMGECDCTTGDGRWKDYLRQAFNRLAATLNQLYSEHLRPLKIDPWKLRNRYIHVLLGELSLEDLVGDMSGRLFSEEDMARLRLLLDSQYHRQRMFTSCGWFFEDFDRIEPCNNVAYAAQAVQLAYRATGIDLAPKALDDLRYVTSHTTGLRGDMVFTRRLRAAQNPISG